VDLATIIAPTISALATIVVTVIGLVATSRARKAESTASQRQTEVERQREAAERIRLEGEAVNARKDHLINELQEDNDRLRSALRARERTRKRLDPGAQ
jgi:hypothetical protein